MSNKIQKKRPDNARPFFKKSKRYFYFNKVIFFTLWK